MGILYTKQVNTTIQERVETLENDVLTLQNYISNLKGKLKNVLDDIDTDNSYPKGYSKYTMNIIKSLIESFE